MQTRFNASDVQYAPVLLVSLPPKRRLSFTIDNARYKVTITAQAPSAVFQEAAALDADGNNEAVKIYMRAARLGSGKAANRLAEVYAEGLLGVPRDVQEAQKWRNAAQMLAR